MICFQNIEYYLNSSIEKNPKFCSIKPEELHIELCILSLYTQSIDFCI
jgi:hypothetical protein